eukprot:TRINITY_DN12727_c0_g3_i1.p1 TRINITY_DN12727_c0_g3~~TRINITY_DN12727_c0_g3_i1.p1  ORF type:complete len:148 (+),score=3.16 TRINITY_DN12727_c0_g3_i1:187-630(+)
MLTLSLLHIAGTTRRGANRCKDSVNAKTRNNSTNKNRSVQSPVQSPDMLCTRFRDLINGLSGWYNRVDATTSDLIVKVAPGKGCDLDTQETIRRTKPVLYKPLYNHPTCYTHISGSLNNGMSGWYNRVDATNSDPIVKVASGRRMRP